MATNGAAMVFALVCVQLVFAPSAWSQEEMSLDEAIHIALKNNRQIQIARLEVSKMEAESRAARTYRLPSLSVRLLEQQPLTHINFDFPPGSLGFYPATGPIPPSTTSIRNPMQPMTIVLAGMDQPLTQLKRIGLGIGLQDLKREEAEARLREQEQSVTNEVKKAYYGLLQTQSALDATADTLKLSREVQRVAEQGLMERVVLKGDVLAADTRVAQTELEQVTLRDSVETEKGALNILLGRPVEADLRVATTNQDTTLNIDPAAARTAALAHRPERAQARLRVLEAEKAARMKRSEAIPDVSLSVNYLGLGNIKFLPSNTLLAGLTVKWDVFDWGRKRDEWTADKLATEQAQAALADSDARIVLEVDRDRRILEEAQARLKVCDLARQTAAENLRVSLDRVHEKTVEMKDVLELQVSLTQANYQYQKALLAFWTAKAEFDKAIGD